MNDEIKSEPIKSEQGAGDSLPRRMRISIEGAWNEAAKLAETVLDTLLVPTGGFSAFAFGWLTTLFFFVLSVIACAVIGLGGLILFLGLECMALLAYAYPGALFLLTVAGGLAPPLLVYWLLHTALGVESSWTVWGVYPVLLIGLFGSYYYWRFGRVIASTGQGALAFYRDAVPKASEIFGAPFAICSSIWGGIGIVLGLFRGVVRESLSLFNRGFKVYGERRGSKPDSPPASEAPSNVDVEGRSGE